ncbi:hypothetical protein K402DRAFT_308236, partial [Aulographum hederae CBS 113979]
NYLADLPQPIPGGQKAPSLISPERQAKITKLEEEAERLRALINEKDVKKRKLERDWEKSERELEVARLKSDLDDANLATLIGDGNLGGA